MTSVVTCPNGHHFLVNPNKHLNRNYRLCPRRGCNAKVIIKRRFSFLPNPDWAAMKQGYRDATDKKRKEKETLERMQQFFGMFSGRRRKKRVERETSTMPGPLPE